MKITNHFTKQLSAIAMTAASVTAVFSMPLSAHASTARSTDYYNACTAGPRLQNRKANEISMASKTEPKQVLIIEGFLSDAVSGYGEGIADSIAGGLGVSKGDISVLSPKSNIPVEQNAELIYEHIRKLFLKNKKPIVVLAHSKGAAEVVMTALWRPSMFLKGWVDKIVSVQGAFYGSPFADIYGSSNPNGFFASLDSWLTGLVFGDALRSMQFDRSSQRIEMAIKRLKPEVRQLISSKVFYAISKVEPENARWYLRPTVQYLKGYGGESDGVLLTADQYIKNFGTVIGKYEADHLALTASLEQIQERANTNSKTSAEPDCQRDMTLDIFSRF